MYGGLKSPQKVNGSVFTKSFKIVPSAEKMKYIIHKCRCTVSCNERFVKKICQLDESKFSWWASNIDHFDGSTTAVVASCARNPALKGSVLEKMDIAKPFNITMRAMQVMFAELQ